MKVKLKKNLHVTHTYTTMAPTIAETSEDDTKAYSSKSQHGLVVWNKAKSTFLSYKKETTQPLHPIRVRPVSWVLSTAGKLLRYLRGNYLLADRNPNFWCFVSLMFSSFFICHLSLYNYSRSANIRPVLSNRVLSSLYQYKTRPLTADWLQVCFWTRSDTAGQKRFS